jgi:mannosyltransferase OCH1-like enzyme
MPWPTKDVMNHASPIVVNGLRNLIDMNPDWEVEITTDDELNAAFPGDVHMAMKSDIWRLHKLYNEGGAYFDLDRLCNVPLDDVVGAAEWVIPFG